MINTGILINNIKTYFEALTWTSPSSSGTTSFSAVFDYPNWMHEQGSPYLVILDDPLGITEVESNMDVNFVNNIQFHICVDWADVTGATGSLKRDEAMLRLREAYDELREELLNEANLLSWIDTPTDSKRDGTNCNVWRPTGLSVEDTYMDEFNVFRRTITVPISDIIQIQ